MRGARLWSSLLMGIGALFLLSAGGGIAWRVLASRPAPLYEPTASEVAQAFTFTATPFPSATQLAAPVSTSTPGTTSLPRAVPTNTSATTEPTSGPPAENTAAVEQVLTAAPTPATSAIEPSPTANPLPSATLLANPSTQAPRLVIDKIDVDAGIVPVSWQVAETSEGAVAMWEMAPPDLVGYHLGTASPGQNGNVVLSGHGNEGACLARLNELEVGDLITIYTSDSRAYNYSVTETALLPEVGESLGDRLANASCMSPTEDARLTLITCWPAWAYTHRLVVVAQLEPR